MEPQGDGVGFGGEAPVSSWRGNETFWYQMVPNEPEFLICEKVSFWRKGFGKNNLEIMSADSGIRGMKWRGRWIAGGFGGVG